MSEQKEQTHFGFQSITLDEKPERVRGLFSSVAQKYDVMNDVMSAGLHRLWKRHFVRICAAKAGGSYIDMAGGTGDIAFALARACQQEAASRASISAETENHISVCDLTPAMLSEGQRRFEKRQDIQNDAHKVNFDWVVCDAAQLDAIQNNRFDRYTISFGLRNVARQQEALNEAYRVLKPGGHFACLEFSQLALPLFERAYDFYSFKVLPKMGQIIANDADSYRYLAESIRMHPPQEELAAMLRKAGFKRVSYQNLSGGIVAIHQGFKA